MHFALSELERRRIVYYFLPKSAAIKGGLKGFLGV
jgi:hypothetical protein